MSDQNEPPQDGVRNGEQAADVSGSDLGAPSGATAGSAAGSAAEVFWVFLRLGLTSFGGPVAHLGYFREEIVRQRNWLSDGAYADLVALCQFMPGPASSQVGLGLGLLRAGGLGALAAWAGFTLPSALIMIAFAYGVGFIGDSAGYGWLAGLKAAAVAVVALAVWGMGKTLAPDKRRTALAGAAAAAMLLAPNLAGPGSLAACQFLVIGAGALIGLLSYRGLASTEAANDAGLTLSFSPVLGVASLALFAALLLALPYLADGSDSQTLETFAAYFRVGGLVFGGGHVVLPLLEAETVARGWINEADFVAGYGAAQAIPGPLFTFAAYLGAASEPQPSGALGGALALTAIFLPSAFLLVGLLPFWIALRTNRSARAALAGVNAAVVGLLAAALYDPVWIHGVTGAPTAALALLSGLALYRYQTSPWAVAVAAAAAGGAMEAAGWL